MQPNGIIHVHAITLHTFDPKRKFPESKMVFIPDKLYHEIKIAVEQFEE